MIISEFVYIHLYQVSIHTVDVVVATLRFDLTAGRNMSLD